MHESTDCWICTRLEYIHTLPENSAPEVYNDLLLEVYATFLNDFVQNNNMLYKKL